MERQKRMDRPAKKQRARARLMQALSKQRALLAEFEDLFDELHVPLDAQNPLRFRLGRLATDYIRFADELMSSRMLTTPEEEEPRHAEVVHNHAMKYSEPRVQRELAIPEPGRRRITLTESPTSDIVPIRELVLKILEEFGVASSPLTIAHYAKMVYEREIRPSGFASLRRDEKRVFLHKPDPNKAWVVAALYITNFKRAERLVASSKWELERRLVGTNTRRVNQLRTLLFLKKKCEEAESNPKLQSRLQFIFVKLVNDAYPELPEVIRFSIPKVAKYAADELDRIEPGDLTERRIAAEKLRELPTMWQLWGAPGDSDDD